MVYKLVSSQAVSHTFIRLKNLTIVNPYDCISCASPIELARMLHPQFSGVLRYDLLVCRTPLLGLGVAWNNKNKNNPVINFMKGAVLGNKEQGVGIRDKGLGIRDKG